MNKHYLNLVAGYEAKQIRRSFIFWVLLLITVVGMNVLQCLLQSDRFMIPTKWSWLMHGQPFSFPLVNAYLYNLVQSFIVLFMATDIFTREQAQGPRESLVTRPVDNGEYLLGKAWGIVRVFVTLAIVSIVICCGVQLLSSTAPFNPGYYLFYFLTLTLPSLLYITGLSFFLTWLTRSRMLTVLLLLVYWGFTIALLPNVFHGLFDFTGSTLSNVFSAGIGHVDGMNYLLHRLMYLLLGLGFIFGTIRLQKRLPNERKKIARWSLLGAALLLIGLLSGGIYARGFLAERKVREAYRAAFARHAKMASGRVSRHDITFEQQGDRVTSKSELTYRNPNATPLSRLLLFLNPGLEVTKLEADRQPLKYERDGQIVLIDRTLNPGDSVRLTMHYAGKIDERVAYLDIDDADYYNTERGDNFFHLGRRHALVSDKAVVLIPEVMWYPMAVAPVNLVAPALTEHDYTLYRLTVEHPKQPTVLSQGTKHQTGNAVEFRPYLPLEGMTLCAGKYEQKSMNLDDIQINYYHFKGNDFFLSAFDKYTHDEIRSIICSDFKNGAMVQDQEFSTTRMMTTKKDQKEPSLAKDIFFRRDWNNAKERQFQIVETPIPFVSHFRFEEERSGYAQPGITLIPERAMGVNLYSFFYATNKKRIEAYFSKRNRFTSTSSSSFFSQLDSATARRYEIKDLIIPLRPHLFNIKGFGDHGNPFLQRLNLKQSYNKIHFNPLYSYSLFFQPNVIINSSRYPMIDNILKRIFRAGERPTIDMTGTSLGLNQQLAFTYLQNHSLEEASSDRIAPEIFQEILKMKTNSLIKRIGIHVSIERFHRFLHSFYLSHYGEVPLDTLNAAIKAKFGFDFDKVLQAWNTKNLTGFRLANAKIEQVQSVDKRRGFMGYMLTFQIQNAGKAEGSVFYPKDKRSYDTLLPSYECLVLQPGECKEVKTRVNINICKIDFDISMNIPNAYELRTTKSSITGDTIQYIKDISPALFATSTDEIIVDNEDEGFRLIYPEKKFLQKLFSKSDQHSWDILLQEWMKQYRSTLHGDLVKSAYSKRGGNGACKAEWSTTIPEEGTYEIFVNTPEHISMYLSRHYYTISGEGLQATEVLSPPFEPSTWISLGKFQLKKGTSRVVLDDRIPNEKEKNSPAPDNYKSLFADAVKWIRVQ